MLSEEEKAKLIELVENASTNEQALVVERIADRVLLDELVRRHKRMYEMLNTLSQIFWKKWEEV